MKFLREEVQRAGSPHSAGKSAVVRQLEVMEYAQTKGTEYKEGISQVKESRDDRGAALPSSPGSLPLDERGRKE